MKIIHAKTTRNRRIRTLPVTGNYLVRSDDGMYCWVERNDRWRMFSPVGGSKCLITNIRRDDTEHSPDLWLYTNLTQREISRLSTETDFRDELITQNQETLDRTRKWRIKQFIEMDRVGAIRFTGLPLTAFWDMWRTPIDTSELQIYGLANSQMKVVYRDFNFNIFIKWPELQRDMSASQSSITKGSTQVTISEKVMPWLTRYCEGGFIPFSDYDTMFQDGEDEFAYLADVA